MARVRFLAQIGLKMSEERLLDLDSRQSAIEGPTDCYWMSVPVAGMPDLIGQLVHCSQPLAVSEAYEMHLEHPERDYGKRSEEDLLQHDRLPVECLFKRT